ATHPTGVRIKGQIKGSEQRVRTKGQIKGSDQRVGTKGRNKGSGVGDGGEDLAQLQQAQVAARCADQLQAVAAGQRQAEGGAARQRCQGGQVGQVGRFLGAVGGRRRRHRRQQQHVELFEQPPYLHHMRVQAPVRTRGIGGRLAGGEGQQAIQAR